MQTQNLRFIKCCLVVCSILLCSTIYGVNIETPQVRFVGARSMSLGGTNPVLNGDMSSVLINPGVLGVRQVIPYTFSHQKILGQFETSFMNYTQPMDLTIPFNDIELSQQFNLSFSYGSNMLHGIPRTEFEQTNYDSNNQLVGLVDDKGRIYQTGSYAAGFDLIHGAIGTTFYDVMGLDQIATGAGMKILRQQVDGNSRSSIGFDIGGIATYNLDQFHLDKVHVGLSIMDFLATSMRMQDTNDEAYIPPHIFLGVRADMFDEKLSLFLHNDLDGLCVGAEYLLNRTFYMRGSTDYETVNMGVGMVFKSVGLFRQDYSLRMDYNYSQGRYPIDIHPTNTFSVSILGEDRQARPIILEPREDLTIMGREQSISGIGPKATTIQIYNNNNLIRTVISDKFGHWKYPYLSLAEGKNELFVKAYAIETEESFSSNKRLIVADTIAPETEMFVYPQGDYLKFNIQSNEALEGISGNFREESLSFVEESDKVWSALVPLPEEIKPNAYVQDSLFQVDFEAIDKIGNSTGKVNFPFYFLVEYPKDKFVQYQKSIRVIGSLTPSVIDLSVNEKSVIFGEDYKFAFTETLKPGKNLLQFKAKINDDQSIPYKLRILSLITFPDLTREVRERREIEFLATLGVLFPESDGYFYPEKEVTRLFITKMMVMINELELEKVEDDIFFDVSMDHPEASYIQTAVNNGLIFAYPDATFKPDQPLTLSEAVFLLSNAGIIEESDETFITETKYVKRRELAQYLAYLPRYEIKIERLIDWEKGYK